MEIFGSNDKNLYLRGRKPKDFTSLIPTNDIIHA